MAWCFDCNFDAEPHRTCGECGAVLCGNCYPSHSCSLVVDEEPRDERHLVSPDWSGKGFFELRDYQIEAIEATYRSWGESDSALLVMPTGTGKTVTFAEVSRIWPESEGRVLVLTHRRQLVQQTAEKIEIHIQERPGIEMGSQSEARTEHMFERSKVLVASVQTLGRESRLIPFDPYDFGLIICDEAHHATSASWLKVLNYFRRNHRLKVLGVTATPERHDEIGLGNVFETCPYQMELREAIDLGWLVNVEQRYVIIEGLDFSSYKKRGKDISDGDVASAMMGGVREIIGVPMDDSQREAIERQEKMLHAVVSPTLQEAQGKPILCFCATKEHAIRTTEIFCRHEGVNAAYILDDTPDEERTHLIRRFKSGDLQALVGVGVFTEGFDAPNAAVIAIARPTLSKALYQQMVGRGTRPLHPPKGETPEARRMEIKHSGKQSCIILDFVGNSGKHKFVSVADVLAGKQIPAEILEAAKLIAIESQEPTDMLSAIEEAERRAKEAKRLRDEKEAEERRKREQARLAQEAKRRADIVAQATYRSRNVELFGADSVPQRAAGKFRGGASDKQVAYLMRFGVPFDTALRYSSKQAGAVITNLKERKGADWICTFGKYAGFPLKDIPPDYASYMVKQGSKEFIENVRIMRGR